ncbi:amidohydrolase [Deltaproteobacteria bacterium]|nr:amidohydrolase [Deltaproteobacteria bacterium]
MLAGLGVLGAAVATRSASAAFPAAVQSSPGSIDSPLPPAPTDTRLADRGGYILGSGSTFTLSNARILVGDGSELQGGLRVENGQIVEIGPGVKSGDDLGGATIFPGFFDGGSPIGLFEIDLEAATHDESEGTDGLLPGIHTEDSYNPASALIPVARRQGVLGGLCLPSGGLVSGQAAWMRFAGDSVAAATMKSSSGVVFNFGRGGTGALPNQPHTRMGLALKLREVLEANKAPDPPDPKAKKKKGEPDKPPEFTRTQKVWHAIRARETKVILSASRADDILAAIAFAKEFNLDAVLLGCAEGHLVARDIAESGYAVLVAPTTTQPGDWESLNAVYENPALLHAAGVKLIMREGAAHNLRELPTEVCVAVANGLPYAAAIAASCGHNAASIWDLPVGTLATGRPATFAIADGDPIQPRTRMLRAWIDGREVTLRSRQTTLFERFRTLW